MTKGLGTIHRVLMDRVLAGKVSKLSNDFIIDCAIAHSHHALVLKSRENPKSENDCQREKGSESVIVTWIWPLAIRSNQRCRYTSLQIQSPRSGRVYVFVT